MSNSTRTGDITSDLSLHGSSYQVNSGRRHQVTTTPAYKATRPASASYLQKTPATSSRSSAIVNNDTKIKTSSRAAPLLANSQRSPPSNKHDQSNDKKVLSNGETSNNIFIPLSVRSSKDPFEFDDYDNIKRPPVNVKSDLLSDFLSNPSQQQENADEAKTNRQNIASTNSSFHFKDIDLKLINPVHDEKLNKLKTSVETLRRELSFDQSEDDKKFNEIQRRLAAVKIQKWYRQQRATKRDEKIELEKLLRDKKNELLKKKQQLESSPSKVVTTKKQTVSSRLLAGKTQTTNDNAISETKANNLDNTTSEREETTSGSSNRTVGDLLTSLDKIKKQDYELKTEMTLAEEKILKSNLTKETDDKINTILSFLSEVETKQSLQSAPPPPLRTALELVDYQQVSSSKVALPKQPAASTARASVKKTTRTIEEDSNFRAKSTTKPPTPKQGKSATTAASIAALSDLENFVGGGGDIDSMTEMTNTILTQRLDIEEKKRTIAMLEKSLNQQRELTIRHTQEADREMQLRLEAQKADYEATIKRHLSFIDQLIDDKKVLSDKCEKLVKELKECEKVYTDRMQKLEEKFKFETNKLKETFEAAEKLRREKWIDEKTKKIKEMTVKGLEPEIQALIAKHKNEIKTLKAMHEAELLQADERAAQRYIRITEELRENYEREKEATVQKERELCRVRYEKSLEEEEKSFLEQRRRLYAEVEEEKNRIAEQGAIQRKEFDRLRKMLEENNFNSIETIKKEYATAQAELEKKHQTEMQNLKEKLDIEKQTWEQNFLKKQENSLTQKERLLKDQVKRERDKEIEMLIARLDAESTLAREECERAAENRIKRIRDKYESELKEVERTERETMERYNSVKAKYNELEGEAERLKVMVRQKDKDFEGIKKLTDTLQDERNRLADVIRQEFSDRLVFTEEESKRIKSEIAELKSRHAYELDKRREEFERLQRDKADELNTVHEKIKQVMASKDETINQLKTQYEAACKRADHLEGLLEQQRKLLLSKTAATAK